MLRIRAQLALMTVGLVAAASAGALFFATREFVLDKQAYVRDLHSVTAPVIAKTLSGTLDHLIDQLAGFDDLILSMGDNQKSGAWVQNMFARLATRFGVVELSVLDEKDLNVILSVAVSDEHMGYRPSARQAAECKQGRRLYRPMPNSQSFALGVWVRSRFYWVWLKPDSFRSEFSSISTFSPMIVDLSGQVIVSGTGNGGKAPGNGPVGGGPTPPVAPNGSTAPATSPSANPVVASTSEGGATLTAVSSEVGKLAWLTPLLAKAANQTLLAKEVTLEMGNDEKDLLVVLAALPETPGIYLVLTTGGAQVAEMVAQGVLAVLPFLAFTLLAAIGVAWLLAVRMARPIEELTSATAKIAAGHWGVRLGAGSTQEVRALMDAFSQMGKELSHREEALNRAHEDLRRSEQLAVLGKFSAGIAHEIKNPLSSILGYCQLLQKRVKDVEDPNVQKFLGFAMDETRRASRIITDLLTFSRQKPPVLSDYRLEEVAAYAHELLQPQAQQFHVELSLNRGLSPVPVRLDRDQYFQVILNLVTNAFHALDSKPEGEPRTVTLTVSQHEKFGILAIRDNGTGITPENMAKLFQPFFSTKGVGKGTGLGLSLCLGIIQQHGGKIEVQSEVNQFTEFKIILPLASPQSQAQVQTQDQTAPVQTQ